jgi:hypothetical protein
MEKNSGDTRARFFGKEPGRFYWLRIARMNTNFFAADLRRRTQIHEVNTP